MPILLFFVFVVSNGAFVGKRFLLSVGIVTTSFPKYTFTHFASFFFRYTNSRKYYFIIRR